jgi:glycosyltransferase involved in cell wall biosynthesis
MRLTADLRMYRHSGIGRYLRNIFPRLLPLLDVDKVRVLARRTTLGDAPWLDDARIELVEAPAPIYSPQEIAMGLGAALRGTDLLWVPHYNAPPLYRRPMVVTIHDIAPVALPEILGTPLKRWYARFLMERAVRHASAILAVSRFTRQELMDRLGVPAGKITVTPLGLDADWLGPGHSAPIAHQETDARPYLLFVGNVKPNKNLTLLLEAFAATLDRLPYRLLIVGRVHGMGTGDEAVLQRARSLGDRVRFAGEVDESTLRSLYAGAAALVLPSIYEGFGLPLLEAMSTGCPVLASNAGSLPEVGGDAALYFDPHSASQLAECLLSVQNPVLMNELRDRGRVRLEHFSFARCASETAAVLNRVARSVQKDGRP